MKKVPGKLARCVNGHGICILIRPCSWESTYWMVLSVEGFVLETFMMEDMEELPEVKVSNDLSTIEA